uniref:Uncharacterized protein n=1 Tax=Rubber waikavirus TaxID=3115795 RepID=A0AAT9JJC7_9SECO
MLRSGIIVGLVTLAVGICLICIAIIYHVQVLGLVSIVVFFLSLIILVLSVLAQSADLEGVLTGLSAASWLSPTPRVVPPRPGVPAARAANVRRGTGV